MPLGVPIIKITIVNSQQTKSIDNKYNEHSKTINYITVFFYLQAMQAAGVEGEQVYFILEDYQLINPEYLDLVNSLLSSGEV